MGRLLPLFLGVFSTLHILGVSAQTAPACVVSLTICHLQSLLLQLSFDLNKTFKDPLLTIAPRKPARMRSEINSQI